MVRVVFCCVLSLAGSSLLRAAELVTFSNGFQLQAESCERMGDVVRLKNGSGTIELPAAEIVRVEHQPASSTQLPNQSEPPSVAKTVSQLVAEAGTAQGLPEEFVLSVAKVESGFRAEAISSKGALGAMQLMPGTATAFGVNPQDPAQNALGGAKYLRQLLLLYQGDARKALAAYNAGPGAVKRFGGVPPYQETQAYIDKVLREYERRKSSVGQSSPH